MIYIRYVSDDEELIENTGSMYYAILKPWTRRIVYPEPSIAMEVYPNSKLYPGDVVFDNG